MDRGTLWLVGLGCVSLGFLIQRNRKLEADMEQARRVHEAHYHDLMSVVKDVVIHLHLQTTMMKLHSIQDPGTHAGHISE